MRTVETSLIGRTASPVATPSYASAVMSLRLAIVVGALALFAIGADAQAMTSHAGWPRINGMLLMNKQDQSRPLDARPGGDPFDGQDSTYSCDGLHRYSTCVCPRQPNGCPRGGVVVPAGERHNMLLGGHGDDVIHAGPWGDVIWGDYKCPCDGDTAQSTTQVDHLYGGPGKDFIFTSHGHNIVDGGGGPDVIHAHFGSGSITCGNEAVLYISNSARRRYALHDCPNISPG
jgi:hypothetical protein